MISVEVLGHRKYLKRNTCFPFSNFIVSKNDWEILHSSVTFSQELRFDLVTSFPDFAEDDSGMEPIENSQWHGHIGDDDPRPVTVELQLNGINWHISSTFLQRVECPHGEIGHQEKCDHLSTGFTLLLVCCVGVTTTGVQYEERLGDGL